MKDVWYTGESIRPSMSIEDLLEPAPETAILIAEVLCMLVHGRRNSPLQHYC